MTRTEKIGEVKKAAELSYSFSLPRAADIMIAVSSLCEGTREGFGAAKAGCHELMDHANDEYWSSGMKGISMVAARAVVEAINTQAFATLTALA